MRVRLLKHWNGFRPGTIFTQTGDGVANKLLDRGLAERVTDDQPAKLASPRSHGDTEKANSKPAKRKK